MRIIQVFNLILSLNISLFIFYKECENNISLNSGVDFLRTYCSIPTPKILPVHTRTTIYKASRNNPLKKSHRNYQLCSLHLSSAISLVEERAKSMVLINMTMIIFCTLFLAMIIYLMVFVNTSGVTLYNNSYNNRC